MTGRGASAGGGEPGAGEPPDGGGPGPGVRGPSPGRLAGPAVLGLGVADLALGGGGPPLALSWTDLAGLLALVLLLQGLARDLAVIRARRAWRADPAAIARRAAAARDRFAFRLNLCVESTLGLVGLAVAAAARLGSGDAPPVLPRGGWLLVVGAALVAGHATRDWVLTLAAVPDHYDLPVFERGDPHDRPDAAA